MLKALIFKEPFFRKAKRHGCLGLNTYPVNFSGRPIQAGRDVDRDDFLRVCV